jgi:hypothetical protein
MLAYSSLSYGMGNMRPGADHFGKFFYIITQMHLISNQVGNWPNKRRVIAYKVALGI